MLDLLHGGHHQNVHVHHIARRVQLATPFTFTIELGLLVASRIMIIALCEASRAELVSHAASCSKHVASLCSAQKHSLAYMHDHTRRHRHARDMQMWS